MCSPVTVDCCPTGWHGSDPHGMHVQFRSPAGTESYQRSFHPPNRDCDWSQLEFLHMWGRGGGLQAVLRNDGLRVWMSAETCKKRDMTTWQATAEALLSIQKPKLAFVLLAHTCTVRFLEPGNRVNPD